MTIADLCPIPIVCSARTILLGLVFQNLAGRAAKSVAGRIVAEGFRAILAKRFKKDIAAKRCR